MAKIVGQNIGFSNGSSSAFAGLVQAASVGTGSLVSFSLETPSTQSRWQISGLGFSDYQNGVPAQGVITEINFSNASGLVFKLEQINIPASVLASYRASGDGVGFMEILFMGPDFLYGSSTDDVLYGYAADDLIYGGAGSDILYGDDGNDSLYGEAGSDMIYGGAGNDTLVFASAGSGNDLLDGGSGDDSVYVTLVSGSSDVLNAFGGDGSDYFSVSAYGGIANVDGGAGNDRFSLVTGGRITGGSGSDVFSPSNFLSTSSRAVITDFQTGAGGDVLDLSDGLGSLAGYTGQPNPFGVGLLRLVQAGADTELQNAQGQVFAVFLGVNANTFSTYNLGGAPADGSNPLDQTFDGTSGIDQLVGSFGKDFMRGFGGADNLKGGVGDDRLEGGDGDDWLDGELGSDILLGGAGNDYLRSISGGVGTDVLDGGDGNDYFELLTYDASTATLNAVGGNGNDTFRVSIDGGTANIDGGAGDDRFDCNYGGRLTGGSGADVYRIGTFGITTPGPIITDFQTGAFGDVVDIAFGLASLPNYSGQGNPFVTGQLRLMQVGADTQLQTAQGLVSVVFQNTRVGDFIPANFSGYLPIIFASDQLSVGTGVADQLNGSTTRDDLRGLDGNDQLSGLGGDDVLLGGQGGDQLNGGADIDTTSYADATAGVYVFMGDAGSWTGYATGDTLTSIENLIGSAFNDILGMDDNANRLEGGAGNDVLYGEGGGDQLFGNDGFDTVSYALAPSGVYVFLTDLGNATGDAAGDSFFSSIESIVGSNFDDIIGMGNFNDMLVGGGGNDVLHGLGGGDRFFGNDGFDTVSYALAGSGVYVFLADLGNATGDAAGDQDFSSIESIVGSNFNDIIGMGNFADTIIAGSGNDILFGMGGNDNLWGGAGNDLFAYNGTGFGADTIRDFQDGLDRIDFSRMAGVNYASLAITSVTGGVQVGLGGSSILIADATISQISAADFLFA